MKNINKKVLDIRSFMSMPNCDNCDGDIYFALLSDLNAYSNISMYLDEFAERSFK